MGYNLKSCILLVDGVPLNDLKIDGGSIEFDTPDQGKLEALANGDAVAVFSHNSVWNLKVTLVDRVKHKIIEQLAQLKYINPLGALVPHVIVFQSFDPGRIIGGTGVLKKHTPLGFKAMEYPSVTYDFDLKITLFV